MEIALINLQQEIVASTNEAVTRIKPAHIEVGPH